MAASGISRGRKLNEHEIDFRNTIQTNYDQTGVDIKKLGEKFDLSNPRSYPNIVKPITSLIHRKLKLETKLLPLTSL